MAKGAQTHLRLRIDDDLLEQLWRSAEKKGRTLTAEITRRLEDSFSHDEFLRSMEEKIRPQTEKLNEVMRRVNERAQHRNHALFGVLDRLLEAIETQTGRQWDSDPETLARAQSASAGAMAVLASPLRWHLLPPPTLDQVKVSELVGLLTTPTPPKPKDKKGKS